MRALRCSSFGSLDAVSLDEIDDPRPGDAEVVVDLVAAAINFPDLLTIAGKYQIKPELPFTVGGEGAGVVSEVGARVKSLKPGDRVAVTGSVGAFAEKIVKREAEVLRVPDSMPFDVAAGFCVAYGTSYYALKQCGQLGGGESVLVLGAAGGVGLAAVDLAKAMGAHVIAAASSEHKLAVARSVGADEFVRYDQEPLKETTKSLTAGKGVDVVFDPVGGAASEQALRAMAWDGRFLVVGFAAGDIPRIPLNLPLLKNCSIAGVFFGAWAQRYPKKYAANFGELFSLYEQGLLHPVVSDQIALEDYRSAFALLSERRATGKVILRVTEEK